jgi:hypothetical protein
MSLPISNNPIRPRLWLIAILALLILLLFAVRGQAQIVTANPGEHALLAAGNALINETVGKEADAQRGTAVLQNTMAAEFTMMKGWEKKYNNYLKTANGYADNIARWVPPVALLWYRCFMRTNISYHSCGTAHI